MLINTTTLTGGSTPLTRDNIRFTSTFAHSGRNMCRRSAVLLVLGLVGVAAGDGGSPGNLVRQARVRGYRTERSYNVGAKGEGDFTIVAPLDEAALGNPCFSRPKGKTRWLASESTRRGYGLRTDNGQPSSGCKTPVVVTRGNTFLRSFQACDSLQQHATCGPRRSRCPYHIRVGRPMSVVSNL